MVLELLGAGLRSLQDYVATHVLTCLVPAFLLAGGLVSFVNRAAVVGLLGEQARRWKSFPMAAVSSFFLAACSCTVIPVASGLYYSGAGVGVAFIVLWVAPAANILALMYTGSILGAEMVAGRVVAAVLVAWIVGLVMTVVFAREEREFVAAGTGDGAAATPDAERILERKHLLLLLLVLLSLLMPNYLVTSGPYIHRVGVWAVFTVLVAAYAARVLSRSEFAGWMRETWYFVRIIFPLLLLGVFLVGIIGAVLPQEWIERWLGDNSLRASFLATLLGAVSYFATLTEAPFVDTLMGLGMGPGPALALLLTGPGISLPNWLAVARVFGVKKALVYVPTIVVLGTLSGYVFGHLVG
ncbi:MAG: permease [Acidobacteriota bacterium]